MAAAQLDAVLTHEGEHVAGMTVSAVVGVAQPGSVWFHPLAWWLERRLSALAEEACDTAVLERGHDPRELRSYLLDLARTVERAGIAVNAVGMAMPGSFLPHRVKNIIDGVRARGSLARARVRGGGMCGFFRRSSRGTLERVVPALRQSHILRQPLLPFRRACCSPGADASAPTSGKNRLRKPVPVAHRWRRLPSRSTWSSPTPNLNRAEYAAQFTFKIPGVNWNWPAKRRGASPRRFTVK